MSPTIPARSPARSAAVVNAQIRALMLAAGGHLRAQDRPVYERLLEEWATAVARELAEAA